MYVRFYKRFITYLFVAIAESEHFGAHPEKNPFERKIFKTSYFL